MRSRSSRGEVSQERRGSAPIQASLAERWPSPPTDTVRSFLRYQFFRAKVRFRTLFLGIEAALFWFVALLAAAWMSEKGFGLLAVILLTLYIIASLPALLIQVLLICDLVIFALSRKSVFYPAMHALSAVPEGTVKRNSRNRSILRGIAQLTTRTSPLAPIGFWAMIVLARLPQSAYVQVDVSTQFAPVGSHAVNSASSGSGSPRRSSPHVLETYWTLMDKEGQALADRRKRDLLPV